MKTSSLLFLLSILIPALAGAQKQPDPPLEWRESIRNEATNADFLMAERQKLAERTTPSALARLAYIDITAEVGTQDYQTALSHAQKAAEEGNDFAYYLLGTIYSKGYGVKQDDAEALFYYRVGAENGDPYAQNSLGIMYLDGTGTKKDEKKALHWFTKSAELGNSVARTNVGIIYHYGYGVDKDFAKSAHHYRLAADRGYSSAQNRLGLMYKNGQGVEQNDAKAYELFLQAAEKGEMYAQYNLGKYLSENSDYSSSKLAAAEWYARAADQGHKTAHYMAAQLYNNYGSSLEYGNLVFKYAKIAAENGDPKGQNLLAREIQQTLYFVRNNPDGNHRVKVTGVDISAESARSWYIKAADQGLVEAMYNLGQFYSKGYLENITEDDATRVAYEWYEKACAAGPDTESGGRACRAVHRTKMGVTHTTLKSWVDKYVTSRSSDWKLFAGNDRAKFYFNKSSINDFYHIPETFVLVKAELKQPLQMAYSHKLYDTVYDGFLVTCTKPNKAALSYYRLQYDEGKVVSRVDSFSNYEFGEPPEGTVDPGTVNLLIHNVVCE